MSSESGKDSGETPDNESGSAPQVAFDPKPFLASLTSKAGVYVMLDANGEVLYVGKARNLKNRVSSYFRASGLAAKTMALVQRIQSIEITVTATETEALLLEQNLIKQYRPQYNIMLKDDKGYPYLYLSDHASPRISLHRGAKRGKGRYFGPYPGAGAVRESLSLMHKVFGLRQCDDSYFSNRSRPCLQYQIGRCSGPCVDAISAEDYQADVRRAVLFLEGKNTAVIAELADQMEQAASTQAYEKAGQLRDQISALQQVQRSQCIEGETGDMDIIGVARRQASACVHLLYVRGGRVLGSRSRFLRIRLDENEAEVMAAFIAGHYGGFAGSRPGRSPQDIPKELVVSHLPDDATWLEQSLSEMAGRRIRISTRVRTNRAHWQELARTAAEQNLQQHMLAGATQNRRSKALQALLQLDRPVARMECFDISHSSGEATVASCVVFDSAGPLKSDYRSFNIEGVTAGDDYAAMRQALIRRYRRVSQGEVAVPDVLFIDGGKGQLRQAKEVMAELDLPGILLVAVAKGSDRKAGLETLIRGDDGRELAPRGDDPALHLIQHIRDESHRFAIGGHKRRRDKTRRTSRLESIPGVGQKRRRELLRHFGGQREIAGASVEDLARVPGISSNLATAIYEALRSE